MRRRAILVLAFLHVLATAGSCGSGTTGDESGAAAFNPCGRMSILLEGQVGSRSFRERQGALLETDGSVTWSVPVGATGTDLDTRQVEAQPTVRDTARQFNATASGGRSDLQIAGTIDAADCSADGSWALLDPDNGRLRGLGTWATR